MGQLNFTRKFLYFYAGDDQGNWQRMTWDLVHLSYVLEWEKVVYWIVDHIHERSQPLYQLALTYLDKKKEGDHGPN